MNGSFPERAMSTVTFGRIARTTVSLGDAERRCTESLRQAAPAAGVGERTVLAERVVT